MDSTTWDTSLADPEPSPAPSDIELEPEQEARSSWDVVLEASPAAAAAIAPAVALPTDSWDELLFGSTGVVNAAVPGNYDAAPKSGTRVRGRPPGTFGTKAVREHLKTVRLEE